MFAASLPAGDRFEDAEEVGFFLEADARRFVHPDAAVLHLDAVGEAAEGLEEIGVRFVAAEGEAGGDVEGHLVAAVRDAAAGGPAGAADGVEDAEVFDQAV